MGKSDTIRETDLYPPLKRFLQEMGYQVKAEIGPCDVVARRADEDPVVLEMKTRFSLTLFHQAIARQSVSDDVYIVVPRKGDKGFSKALKENRALCRRLGLGLITVRLEDDLVELHLDPAPYRPRQSKPRKGRLLREFARRMGDPNRGGQTRAGLVTAYRQDALKCARYLAQNGIGKGAQVAAQANVPRATRIMADNHYGWFERVCIGHYQLTVQGHDALRAYCDVLGEEGSGGPPVGA